MANFLQRLREASAQGEKRAAAHRERRIAAGLQETAGTGTPEPEIAFEAIEPTNFPEDVEVANLEKILQAMEASTLEGMPIGASRLGGLPDLPSSVEWPLIDGKKLPFIAQLNLSDVPRPRMNMLNNSGWLYVFGVLDDEKDTLVTFTYNGNTSALSRAKRPAVEQVWADWCGTQYYSTVPLRVAEGDVHSVWDNLGCWLFGEMSDAFGTPGKEADLAMKDGDDWINLLAVTSVGNMLWSDSGHLYLLIRRSDLEQSDFGRVFGVIKSS